jgi:hypothetical protein
VLTSETLARIERVLSGRSFQNIITRDEKEAVALLLKVVRRAPEERERIVEYLRGRVKRWEQVETLELCTPAEALVEAAANIERGMHWADKRT